MSDLLQSVAGPIAYLGLIALATGIYAAGRHIHAACVRVRVHDRGDRNA
jgi:hypothetical protein